MYSPAHHLQAISLSLLCLGVPFAPEVSHASDSDVEMIYGAGIEFSGFDPLWPGQIALGKDGTLYVLGRDSKVDILRPNGEFQRLDFQSHPLIGQSSINDLFVDPAGNLYLKRQGTFDVGNAILVYKEGNGLQVLSQAEGQDLKSLYNWASDKAGWPVFMFIDEQLTASFYRGDANASLHRINAGEEPIRQTTDLLRFNFFDLDVHGNLYLWGQAVRQTVNAYALLKVTPDGQIQDLPILKLNGLDYEIPRIRHISVNRYGEVILLESSVEDTWRTFRWTAPGLMNQIMDSSGIGTGSVETIVTGYFGHLEREYVMSGNPMVNPVYSDSDALGNTYIAASTSNNVFRVRRDGTRELVLDETGDRQGRELKEPIKVLVGPGGDVYVFGYESRNVFRVKGAGISPMTDILSRVQPEPDSGIPDTTEILYGDDSANTLGVSGGEQIIIALGGDDELKADSANNRLYGGDGNDVAKFPEQLYDYALSQNPLTGDTDVIFKDGSLAGQVSGDIERLGFLDAEIPNMALGYWGESQSVLSGSEGAIYRFYNVRSRSFFYTADFQEAGVIFANSAVDRDPAIRWPYVYQGVTFASAHTYDGAINLHRFYNSETGHHFFTASEEERANVQSQIDAGRWPYVYEGIAYKVYPDDPTPGVQENEIPVHRYYSPTLNRHVYTGSEREALLFLTSDDWTYEGIAFYGEKP